jgi:hypothetical protein
VTTTVPGSSASPAFVVGIIKPGLDTLLAGVLQDERKLAGSTMQLIQEIRKPFDANVHKFHESGGIDSIVQSAHVFIRTCKAFTAYPLRQVGDFLLGGFIMLRGPSCICMKHIYQLSQFFLCQVNDIPRVSTS